MSDFDAMRSVEQQGKWLAALPYEKKLLFLSALAHQLTIIGRNSYRPQTEELDKPAQLRRINEVQHRVLACLVQLQLGHAVQGFQESIAGLVLQQDDLELRDLMSFAWRGAMSV